MNKINQCSLASEAEPQPQLKNWCQSSRDAQRLYEQSKTQLEEDWCHYVRTNGGENKDG